MWASWEKTGRKNWGGWLTLWLSVRIWWARFFSCKALRSPLRAFLMTRALELLNRWGLKWKSDTRLSKSGWQHPTEWNFTATSFRALTKEKMTNLKMKMMNPMKPCTQTLLKSPTVILLWFFVHQTLALLNFFSIKATGLIIIWAMA